jgi:hypothetical protein
MKRLLICFATVLVVLCISFSGCSKDEGVEADKGRIEKMTDHAADIAVGKIRTPIDQARSVKDVEESRMRDLDETLKEQ